MVKFTDEHKKDNTFVQEGIHKCKIARIEFGTTDADKEYVEFGVKTEDGKEDSARLWFTTDKAIAFTFSIIKGIFVHNAPEGKKDEARAAIDALGDTTELEKACKVLVGKEVWLSVYQNKNRPYQNAQGETRYSFDKNITGYEPSPRTMTPEHTTPDNTEPIKHTDEDGKEQLISDF